MRVYLGIAGISLMTASAVVIVWGVKEGLCALVFGMGLGLFVDSLRK